MTAALFVAGDLIAQQAVESRGWRNHQWSRTARLAGFGLLVAGPALSHWYRFLDRRVTIKHPVHNLFARVALDQFAFSPISVAVFFTFNGVLEGLSKDEIERKLRANYTTALVNNWKVWIGVQLANFWFVPLQHRVLVVQSVAIGWNTYLSNLNARAVPAEVAEETKVV
ncbi:hypothetical protein BCR44DRAFT_1436233 [Catenaria anguillulae PL171]|uniref:Uncharacterized protein n=1 Tax=Catenaria anguillulae PL171 TaxID=765915 RepID=A0A1Y2HL57_9FUNG|nr:hypothetical protein BCR44DRAFT_1436233 [Catenaria anguillulae PL171]